jgi:hypothetical protein
MCSMYGIYTYIWVMFRANVGKYSIHGAYGWGYHQQNRNITGLQSDEIYIGCSNVLRTVMIFFMTVFAHTDSCG